MYIYKKDDPVPMKFHYVVIFFMAYRALINIGGIPELLDTEEMLRGTAYDWYGKFFLSTILLLTGVGVFGTIAIFKRLRSGPPALYVYLGGECAVKLVEMLLEKEITGEGSIVTAFFMTLFYLVGIAVCWVYYEKRREIFGERKVVL